MTEFTVIMNDLAKLIEEFAKLTNLMEVFWRICRVDKEDCSELIYIIVSYCN